MFDEDEKRDDDDLPSRPRLGMYILVNKTPIEMDDTLTWGRWMEANDRHVAQTYIGAWNLSTVFLGLDHRFGMSGPPILFETMAFFTDRRKERRLLRCRARGKKIDWSRLPRISFDFQFRYATWYQAFNGHREIVPLLMQTAAHVMTNRQFNELLGEKIL